jgi:hypothetical protein
MNQKISSLLLLICLCVLGTIHCANETAEPAIIFQKMLEEAAIEDMDMRSSIAHYYLTIPERSKHEKTIKLVLADDFKDKYGTTIEEVVQNMPASEKPSTWSYYVPYFLNYGVPSVVAIGLAAILYGRSSGGEIPGRLSSDQETMIRAAQWFNSAGVPTPRTRPQYRGG